MNLQLPAVKPAQDAADNLTADSLAVDKYAVGQSVGGQLNRRVRRRFHGGQLQIHDDSNLR